MTKTEALKALLEKVEARHPTCPIYQINRAFSRCFQRVFRDAFHGSLDAAKALHKALLPGWMYCHVPCAVTVARQERLHDGMIFDAPSEEGMESRAWLIAILKALIAIEEQEA